jgi:hypothetical protein
MRSFETLANIGRVHVCFDCFSCVNLSFGFPWWCKYPASLYLAIGFCMWARYIFPRPFYDDSLH